jgi:signal transduction histidine kinase
MENYIIFISGSIISCLVNGVIVFQFIEERNERSYHNKYLYFFIEVAVSILIVFLNLLNNPVLNIASWIILPCLVNITLFHHMNKKVIHRMADITVLILILSICEAVGVELLDYILWRFQILRVDSFMAESMEITFSKLFVLISYYQIIAKLWREDQNRTFNKTQCLIELFVILYSIANLAVILLVISKVNSQTDHILILINMGCILIADLYFSYFARFVEENSQLKIKLKLLEQQSTLQYEFYEEQGEKYNESIKILHDVNKHLNMIENLYEAKKDDMAKTYAKEIGQMLIPLSLEDYTNNPILNVLLNDKKRIASIHSICFNLDIGAVDLSFMEPIEVTTVFGNLLDNAIEACDLVPGHRYIDMKLNTYNEFIVLNISNCTIPIEKWNFGKPVSRKGKSHGIGLLNVENIIKKYNGSMVLEEANKKFSCKIIFNL